MGNHLSRPTTFKFEFSSDLLRSVQFSSVGPSRGFLCPQAAAECGSSMGGAVIGGWTLRALSRSFHLLSSPTFLGASTHFFFLRILVRHFS